jgi:phosphoglycerol transferase MdoB-like AlkP superfamily enzyme
LSSHVPYKVPGTLVFPGEDETSKFLNSVHYTDDVIGNFIKECKKQPWWKNTIIIITADHGIRFPTTGKVIDDFKIPMLWLGGAIEKNKGVTIGKLASQIDLSATLVKQYGWNVAAFPFSRDITDSTSTSFSFFSNSVSFALLQPNRYFIYDAKGQIVKEQEGTITEKDINVGKALQQFIYDDYLKK